MIAHTPGPWGVHGRRFIVPSAHLGRPLGAHEDDAMDIAHYAHEIALLHLPDRTDQVWLLYDDGVPAKPTERQILAILEATQA